MADDEQVIEEAGRGTHWLTWALYAGLIGVNAWLVYDAYPKPNPVSDFVAELDIEARIDHRTLEAQGIDLEPQSKIGPAGARRLDRGEDAERAVDGEDIDTVPDVVPPS